MKKTHSSYSSCSYNNSKSRYTQKSRLKNRDKNFHSRNNAEDQAFYLKQSQDAYKAKQSLLKTSEFEYRNSYNTSQQNQRLLRRRSKPKTAQTDKNVKKIDNQFEGWLSLDKYKQKGHIMSQPQQSNQQIKKIQRNPQSIIMRHRQKLKSSHQIKLINNQSFIFRKTANKSALNESLMNSFKYNDVIMNIVNIQTDLTSSKLTKQHREDQLENNCKKPLKKTLNLNNQVLSISRCQSKHYQSLNLSATAKSHSLKKQIKDQKPKQIVCSKSSIMFEEQQLGPQCVKLETNKMKGSAFKNQKRANNRNRMKVSGKWIKPDQKINSSLCKVYKLSNNSKIIKDIKNIVSLLNQETNISPLY